MESYKYWVLHLYEQGTYMFAVRRKEGIKEDDEFQNSEGISGVLLLQ